jgi:tetratricopeptide (TPR) repeat protein
VNVERSKVSLKGCCMRNIFLLCVSILAAAAPAAAQSASAQQLFEGGQNDQALREITAGRARGAAGPAEAFLAGQILVKMGRNDEARQEFGTLARTGAPDWVLVGQSSLALLDNDNQRALETATSAVARAPDQFHTQYQLGLARARFEDWAGCAEAFRRATELNPTFAYAHYYAGLSYSRIKRADRTSEHFERVLKLAPRAPERAAVESLMRTLRGA